MLCGWEGNRRSGVALAMRHRLSGIYPPTDSMALGMEMGTPPKLHLECYGIFTFTAVLYRRHVQIFVLTYLLTHSLVDAHQFSSRARPITELYLGSLEYYIDLSQFRTIRLVETAVRRPTYFRHRCHSQSTTVRKTNL